MDPLKPNATVLAKLGSIAVHAEEMLSPAGHAFDHIALKGLLSDPDVTEWLEGMRKMTLLPEKR